jgi:hypothetical protein
MKAKEEEIAASKVKFDEATSKLKEADEKLKVRAAILTRKLYKCMLVLVARCTPVCGYVGCAWWPS